MRGVRGAVTAVAGAVRGAGSLLAALVVVGALAWLLAGRGTPGTGPTSGDPAAVAAAPSQPAPTPGDADPSAAIQPSAGAVPAPTGDPAAVPSVTAAPVDPTAEPTPASTPVATPVPATPKPTPKPTPRPTPRPTHDPAPEPTPRVRSVFGSFGQTLTTDGISVRMARRDASQNPSITCGTSDDPEMQGFTDVVSYDLRITWSDPGDASEPWIAVGATPYHALWFDPQVASGVDVVFATCKRPDDSFTAVVEITPADSMDRTDRFTFR